MTEAEIRAKLARITKTLETKRKISNKLWKDYEGLAKEINKLVDQSKDTSNQLSAFLDLKKSFEAT